MSTPSIHLDAHLPARRIITRELHARHFAGNDGAMRFPERLSEAGAAAMSTQTSTNGGDSGQDIPPLTCTDLNGLSTRMRLLTRSAGGPSAVARRCGFSANVVRNWCHGRSDISRERCVIVARALGISLRWLASGEGSMHDEDDPGVHAPMPQAVSAPDRGEAATDAAAPAIDSGLLAAAYRVLQSYIGLVGGSLGPMQRADALVQLYHVLGHTDCPGHAERMVAFHSALGSYFCRKPSLSG